ncbi:MAG: PepSY domain-containing protein [Paludibacter sp.]
MKKIFHQLHLWLGLASGLLVFIIAITGSLYAFQEEITGLGKYHYVEERNENFMLPSKLGKIAENLLPGKELHAVKYNGNGKAAEAIFYGYNPTCYYIVYLNPYTGEVQKVKRYGEGFFPFYHAGAFLPVVATENRPAVGGLFHADFCHNPPYRPGDMDTQKP